MSIVVAKGRVSRTKKCIIDALFVLMEKDHFDDITVTQITQEADIARRTFYLNFNSKYEVLEYYIKILYEEYVQSILEKGTRSFEYDVVQFFEFWKQHSEILYLLEKNERFFILLSEFENILIKTEHFDFSLWYERGISKKKHDYIASILSAVLWRVLKRWVQNNMKESVSEVVETFMHVIQ